jgi:hypothetical protein
MTRLFTLAALLLCLSGCMAANQSGPARNEPGALPTAIIRTR